MKEMEWIDELAANRTLPNEALASLIGLPAGCEAEARLFARARAAREAAYGRAVYVRGLIEFTNVCARDCLYCGLRRSNGRICRYRLTEDEILRCCETGYALGLRTFVMQGGEDAYFTDERLVRLVSGIKARWPDCAVTLSVGERTEASYRRLREAGCDRYLLRHETASPEHYARLHPAGMRLETRLSCLRALKRLGYAVGCGMMVGSPGQGAAELLRDLRFMEDFRPEMIGVGPFIPQKDTPLGDRPAGSAEMTLRLIAVLRLMHPLALIPATTALSTADARGHQKGMLAGANVVMPNLSPLNVREKYALYDGKAYTGSEAAESLARLRAEMEEIGYEVAVSRGDPATRVKGAAV